MQLLGPSDPEHQDLLAVLVRHAEEDDRKALEAEARGERWDPTWAQKVRDDLGTRGWRLSLRTKEVLRKVREKDLAAERAACASPPPTAARQPLGILRPPKPRPVEVQLG
jgi:hypothetical protein